MSKNLKFHSLNLKKGKKIRFTLDYPEDLVFFRKIYSKFPFTVETTKVINYLKRFKNISKINYFRQNDYLTNQRKIMKDYKGWKFKGKELSYIREVLSSDFKAKSSGTMNERLSKICRNTQSTLCCYSKFWNFNFTHGFKCFWCGSWR